MIEIWSPRTCRMRFRRKDAGGIECPDDVYCDAK